MNVASIHYRTLNSDNTTFAYLCWTFIDMPGSKVCFLTSRLFVLKMLHISLLHLIEDEIILTTTLPRIKAVSRLFELYLRREGGYPDFHY